MDNINILKDVKEIYKDKKHIVSIIIIIILLIGSCLLINKNNENFIDPTTTLQPPPVVPVIPSPLIDALQNSYESLNTSRFNTLDNQEKINNLDKRLHKIKVDLAVDSAISNKSTNPLYFY